MSLTTTTTTTTTTTRLEALTDLQRRLQAPPAPAMQQVRFRTGAATTRGPAGPESNPTLTRRFSFVWPFISKENAAAAEPFLKSRCSQLLRQFPAFIGGDESARTLRDLISRVLTQLKAVWLVLAVYMSLLVLTFLGSAVLYTFVLAAKPPGLWFLVGCIAATGAIASVSFSVREHPRRRQQQLQQLQAPQPVPSISVN